MEDDIKKESIDDEMNVMNVINKYYDDNDNNEQIDKLIEEKNEELIAQTKIESVNEMIDTDEMKESDININDENCKETNENQTEENQNDQEKIES